MRGDFFDLLVTQIVDKVKMVSEELKAIYDRRKVTHIYIRGL